MRKSPPKYFFQMRAKQEYVQEHRELAESKGFKGLAAYIRYLLEQAKHADTQTSKKEEKKASIPISISRLAENLRAR